MISLEHKSHKEPSKYRVSFEDASRVLSGSYLKDNSLPVRHSKSTVAIIGCGFGGIATAIECITNLKVEDFAMFEKHDQFGGTWYANTYPGCASDVPAIWYSLSTDINNTWSSVQPPQYEIEEYILKVAEKYDLRRRAVFQTTVERIVYNESEANWTLYIRDLTNGQRIEHVAKVVMSASGTLVTPSHLKTKGLEKFKGQYMHSGVYDHSVPIKGKKVLVIGSGCSSCQLVPSLLNEYDPESVIQLSRSKQYILPPVPTALQRLYLRFASSYLALTVLRYLVIAVAQIRYPMFRGVGWSARIIRRHSTNNSLRYMEKNTPEKYRDQILPDFKIGCKRLIFDNKYLASLHHPKFKLVSSELQEITEDSVIFADGTTAKVDVIIACTGYALGKSFESVEMIGRNGVNITKMWRDKGATAYQTTLVKDAPNLFLIGGPNIASGHTSFLESAESALKFASLVSRKVLDGTNKSVCVKSSAYDDWFTQIQKDLETTVFGTSFGGCTSWYAQEGYNATTYPYSSFYMWWTNTHPKWEDIELVKSDKKTV